MNNSVLKSHMLKSLAKNIRYDGRKLDEYREISVQKGVTKTALMCLSKPEIDLIMSNNNITVRSFFKNYVVARRGKSGVCLFQATYDCTAHSRPPEDGKLRDINPDLYWLTVSGQHILPRPGVWKHRPLAFNYIYS